MFMFITCLCMREDKQMALYHAAPSPRVGHDEADLCRPRLLSSGFAVHPAAVRRSLAPLRDTVLPGVGGEVMYD